MAQTILVLPGFGNSGDTHWQSIWEKADPSMRRIEGQDWDRVICGDWVVNLEETVRRLGPDTILLAHSLGCLQVAHWAQHSTTPIKAAMLVAVPEPSIVEVPDVSTGFAPLQLKQFSFPSLVVASTDDPYGSAAHARECATAWGSEFVEIGERGHINGNSGLGEWTEGRRMLNQLAAKIRPE